MVLFGTFCAALGLAQNYSTVLALRVLIGSSQAFIQGLSLYASLWYKRDELATRAGNVNLTHHMKVDSSLWQPSIMLLRLSQVHLVDLSLMQLIRTSPT